MDYNEQKKGKFLKILCIISIIAAVISIASAIYSYLNIEKTVETTQLAIVKLDDAGIDEGIIYNATIKAVNKIVVISENISMITSTTIFIKLISIFGVLLMFQFRKKGFYIYSAAAIIILAPQVYLFGFYDIILELVISIIFIALYAANLKYMTN